MEGKIMKKFKLFKFRKKKKTTIDISQMSDAEIMHPDIVLNPDHSLRNTVKLTEVVDTKDPK